MEKWIEELKEKAKGVKGGWFDSEYSGSNCAIQDCRDDAFVRAASPDSILQLISKVEELTEQVEKMLAAINWVTGTVGDFNKPEGAPAYWWRSRLIERAGLVYNAKAEKFELPSPPAEGDQG